MSRQKHRWMSDSVRRLDDDEWCRLDWLGKWAQKHRERKPGSSMLIDPQARDVLPLAVAYLQLMEQSCLDITLRRLRHVTKQRLTNTAINFLARVQMRSSTWRVPCLVRVPKKQRKRKRGRKTNNQSRRV